MAAVNGTNERFGHEMNFGNISDIGPKLSDDNVTTLQEKIKNDFNLFILSQPFKSWKMNHITVLNEHIRFEIKYTEPVNQEFRSAIQKKWKNANIQTSDKGVDSIFIPFKYLISKDASVRAMQFWTVWDSYTILCIFAVMLLVLYIQYLNKPDKYSLFEYLIPSFLSGSVVEGEEKEH